MELKPILLAEDNPNDQILIKRAFSKRNIDNPVHVANDGAEALDMLFGTGAYAKDGPLVPAVVLLDLKMPKVDGLEVLERMKSDDRTRHIPVVILTTSDEQSDIVRSYDLGVNSFVRKPIDFAEFAECVANLGLYWLLVNRTA
jgi:two-component system response regulator